MKVVYQSLHIVMKFYNTPLCSLSSTFIRNEIRNNRQIDYYCPKEVIEYIKKHKLYIENGEN